MRNLQPRREIRNATNKSRHVWCGASHGQVRKWPEFGLGVGHSGGMEPLDPDLGYRALQTRDPRFDGRLFVGVISSISIGPTRMGTLCSCRLATAALTSSTSSATERRSVTAAIAAKTQCRAARSRYRIRSSKDSPTSTARSAPNQARLRRIDARVISVPG